MQTFSQTFSSLRSYVLCASAALLVVACGDSSDSKPNASDTSSVSTAPGGHGTASAGPTAKRVLGAYCETSDQCQTGNCRAYSIVTDPTKPNAKLEGKSCSACNSDADCTDPAVGNLCVPAYSEKDSTTLHYVCGRGDLGDGCVDTSHCGAGKVCGGLILGFSSCGECLTNAECKDPSKPQCVITKDQNTGKSYRACGGKLADGANCVLGPNADEQCINYCAVLTNPLLPEPVGVCSPCKDESQCAPGQTCAMPRIDVSNPKDIKFAPASCEPSKG